MLLSALLLLVQTVPAGPVPAGEEPVEPYAHANANAGATPFKGDGMWTAFGGQAGVDRLIERFVSLNTADRRIGDIFKGQDIVRLRRVLKEHFCYILNGGCDYSGRNMKDAHRDMGVQQADMGAMVENLQAAMRAENIDFRAQNRLLGKLAPMKRDVVER